MVKFCNLNQVMGARYHSKNRASSIKLMSGVISILLAIVSIALLSSCNEDTTYTVTFDSKGGSPTPTVQAVAEGGKVINPPDPTLANHDFVGWATADNVTSSLWNFEADIVTGDMTLFARWAVGILVTFNSNGGTEIPPQVVEHGALAIQPADPIRDGYAFGGWFKEAALTNEWNFDVDVVTAAVTLYAKWTARRLDIYVAGNEGEWEVDPISQSARHRNFATVWKNGERLYRLTDGGFLAYANSVFVSVCPEDTERSDDVYAAGEEWNAQVWVAKVWKNGSLLYTLSDGTSNAHANSVFVYNGDVYVAGHERVGHRFVAKVWKNGSLLYTISNGILAANANSVFVYNGDVYVAGQEEMLVPVAGSESDLQGIWVAKVWKNGLLLHNLTDGTGDIGATATSVYVSGGNVYTAGNEYNAEQITVAKVWRNNTLLHTLTDGTLNGRASSVFVSNDVVYVAGTEYSADLGTAIAKVWRNGTDLPRFRTNNAWANSIHVLGNDVYVAGVGHGGSGFATIWINGVAQEWGGAGAVSPRSIFVVERLID